MLKLVSSDDSILADGSEEINNKIPTIMSASGTYDVIRCVYVLITFPLLKF